MSNPTKQGITSLKDSILAKASIIMRFQDKPTVLLPVGSEWDNPSFSHGLHMRTIEMLRINVETTAVKIDGLAGSRMEEHYHDNREAIMCIQGLVRIKMPDAVLELRALDHCVIPIGAMHALEFVEDSQLLVAWHPKFD